MKNRSIILISAAAILVLLLAGCPSPFGTPSSGTNPADSDVSTATVAFDNARGAFVFTEEDGTEIPVVFDSPNGKDGPIELIDYAILGGSQSASRHSSNSNTIRCIVVGRRSDGRSGVWVIYRHGGAVVLPNEDGIEDSALMKIVEVEGSPYLGDDWVYDAKAISDDGKIIIGQLSRPGGWEYLDDNAPDPSIGVWWTIHERNGKLIISRAKPILLMSQPKESTIASRHMSRDRLRAWKDMLIEWLQAMFLTHAWNYLSEATGFVDPGDIDVPVKTGEYVVSGTDKNGTASWAWITAHGVENIIDAPIVEEQPGPFPVIGPETMTFYQNLSFRQPAQLVIETADPDGTYTDVITYGASDLPDFLTLEGDTVIAEKNAVPADPDGNSYYRSVGFFSVDAEGNKSEPHWINIEFKLWAPS